LAVFGVHGIGGMWGALATGLFVGVGYGAPDAPIAMSWLITCSPRPISRAP
jgi:ammonia channel protein AmtB